jgi:hypothetical protein
MDSLGIDVRAIFVCRQLFMLEVVLQKRYFMRIKLFSLLVVGALSTACCYKKALIPTIAITYPATEKEALIVVNSYKTDHTLYNSASTNVIVQADPFEYRLQVIQNVKYYIIEYFQLVVTSNNVDSTLVYSDSISDVMYEINGRCNDKLEKFSYHYNGAFTTDSFINK